MKNPTCPIWILASETHLTVFFSKVYIFIFSSWFHLKIFRSNLKETGLIQNNNENRQDAIKKFQTHDPYGSFLEVKIHLKKGF